MTAINDAERCAHAMVDEIHNGWRAAHAEAARLQAENARLTEALAHMTGERMKHYHDAVQALNDWGRELDRNEVLTERVKELEERLNARVDAYEPANDLKGAAE